MVLLISKIWIGIVLVVLLYGFLMLLFQDHEFRVFTGTILLIFITLMAFARVGFL